MGLFNKKSAKQTELEKQNADLKEQLNKIRAENADLKAEKQKLEKDFAEKQSALTAEIYRLNKKFLKSGKFDARAKTEKSGDPAEPTDGESAANEAAALAAVSTVTAAEATAITAAATPEVVSATDEKAENSPKNADKFAEENEKDLLSLAPETQAELKTLYVREINRLKTFIARWEKALAFGDPLAEKRRKAALSAALKQILNFNEQELGLSELSQKVTEITDLISGGKREEGGGIDLDEILNPSEDLDLETLCRQLGTME